MSITTYDELKVAVADWLDRKNMDAIIPTLIDLAQTKIYRTMRLGQWEVRSITDTVGGEMYIQRPPSSNGIVDIKLNTNPLTVLEYKPSQEIDSLWAGSVSGKPVMFTIVGDQIRLAPTPDAAYELEVAYIQKPQMLSDAVQTNWVMENAPDLLLYGALLEATPYIKDDARIQVWLTAFEGVKAQLEEQDEEIKYPFGTVLEQVV